MKPLPRPNDPEAISKLYQYFSDLAEGEDVLEHPHMDFAIFSLDPVYVSRKSRTMTAVEVRIGSTHDGGGRICEFVFNEDGSVVLQYHEGQGAERYVSEGRKPAGSESSRVEQLADMKDGPDVLSRWRYTAWEDALLAMRAIIVRLIDGVCDFAHAQRKVFELPPKPAKRR